ncbi:putative reverse transcriptase domain, reverse transcriptase zinc-binding domain protein [Tanacetum coccineum]
MERGFLDYSDKKKKEGGAKEDDGAIPILGDLAKHVKNIEGKTTMPKGILKKVVRNVSSDTHEVVMPLNDVGSGSKVNFEVVGKSNANYTTNVRNLGSDPMDLATNKELSGSSSSSAQSTMGSEQEVFTSNDGPKTGNSFASLLRSNEVNNKVHFRTLDNEERVESVDCVLPKAAAAKVKSRYENSIVGFFVGKDPSFPFAQQYVSNTWRKFRFEKITRNDDGVYLFKFASKSGEVTKVPVWVKLYNVPVLAYSEDGLSLIATQISKPIMLDAFTSSMCVESWGRISFARALIEISAHSVLKKEVTMAISDEEGDGYTKEIIRVVYEWKPPHCVNCQSFGHDPNLCPKLIREKIPKTSAMDVKANTMEENDDGFVEVKSRKKKKGADSRSFGGLRLNKPNSKVIWQQKKGVDAKGGSNSASPSVSTNDNEKGNGCSKPDLNSPNPFDVFNVEGEEMGDSGQQPKDKNVSSSPALKTWDCINESDTDDEDVIPSYGSSLGGGNQLEDNDFDFSDGYEDQVVDFSGQLKEFCDFKLSMCGVSNQRMSTPVFVDPKSSTQADGAQSSRVPVPLPEDPYEAIRQTYLDGTNIESEPFEDPIDTETPETARMVVRVPPAMSSGLSASIAEVATMSESAFRKRFRSSYKSSPSVSPPDLPARKCYRGTSELVEDGEKDDDEEDEEIKESLDSDNVSEDAEDEGPTTEDKDPAAGDEGLAVGSRASSRGLDDEGHSVESDGLSLEEEEAVPEGQQQAAPVVRTAVSAPLGLGYGALRRRELALEEDYVYSTFKVGQGFGFALESEIHETVSASRQPTLTTWTDPEDGMVYIDVPTYPPPAPPVQTPPSPE